MAKITPRLKRNQCKYIKTKADKHRAFSWDHQSAGYLPIKKKSVKDSLPNSWKEEETSLTMSTCMDQNKESSQYQTEMETMIPSVRLRQHRANMWCIRIFC